MNELSMVPKDGYYLFKSCVMSSAYPGVEKSIRYVLDAIGASYTDDPRHSSCSGFGYHCGLVPLKTNLALNARNFSLVSDSRDRNIVCTCPTSYGNLKDCAETLSHDEEARRSTDEVLHKIGREYCAPESIYHISDIFFTRLDDIKAKAVRSFNGVRAATHHGCHYAKLFNEGVTAGDQERPEVLDEIARGFGCNIVEYEERALCCGMGFHHTLLDRKYPRAVLQRKFASLLEAKPEVIVTGCPGCLFNLDYYQESISKAIGRELDIPVLYFSEMAALALGADPLDIGLDMHIVPVEPLLKKAGIIGGLR